MPLDQLGRLLSHPGLSLGAGAAVGGLIGALVDPPQECSYTVLLVRECQVASWPIVGPLTDGTWALLWIAAGVVVAAVGRKLNA